MQLDSLHIQGLIDAPIQTSTVAKPPSATLPASVVGLHTQISSNSKNDF